MKDGIANPGNGLKADIALLNETGKTATKILNIEASGIAIACAAPAGCANEEYSPCISSMAVL